MEKMGYLDLLKAEKKALSGTAKTAKSPARNDDAIHDNGVAVETVEDLVCFCCRGQDSWKSIHGRWICRRCHPPAALELEDG
jgi:hypothetical protein